MKILYEDEDILAVDKPAGLLVYLPRHIKTTEETLLGKVSDRLNFPSIGERTGVVHRLDRDTSGVIMFAKNSNAEKKLKEVFKTRQIKKYYVALVHGKMEHNQGRITIPLGRAPKDRLKVIPKSSGKPSETLYRVLRYYPDKNISKLEIELRTGRMHQIRVHLAAIGHPVVGDKLYGRKSDKALRQLLHAERVEFISPFTNKLIKITSGLPKDFTI